MNNPVVKLYTGLARLIAIGEAKGTRRVVSESLTHDSIKTWAVFANIPCLFVWEVVVARPT